MEKLIRISMHDGNGKLIPTPGESKWIPGTILGIHDITMETKWGWGDEAAFFIFLGYGKALTQEFILEAKRRKKAIDVTKFLSAETKQKYIDNADKIFDEFLKKQAQFGYKAAESMYRHKFSTEGEKPDFTKKVDLDVAGTVIATPEWQWVKDEVEPPDLGHI